MATSFVYGSVLTDAFSGNINFPASTVQALLLDNTYTPNQDAHSRISHLTGELTAGSYSRQTLGSKSLSYDAGTNTLKATSASPIVFPSLTATFRYLVIALNMGTPSTSPLLMCVDYLTDQAVTGLDANFNISGTTGLFQATVA